jgi:hypothetical protein
MTVRSFVEPSFEPPPSPVLPDEEEGFDSVVVVEQPDAVTVVMSPAIAETLASANNFLVTITRLLELLFAVIRRQAEETFFRCPERPAMSGEPSGASAICPHVATGWAKARARYMPMGDPSRTSPSYDNRFVAIDS